MLENRILRKILGLRGMRKREWRLLYDGKLYDLYSSQNITQVIKRRMRWVGYMAHMGDRRGEYRVLVGRPEGKRRLGIPRHRWEDR
jgi:hypothetical protein